MNKVKDILGGIVLFALMYVLMVMMFILDGAPFHNQKKRSEKIRKVLTLVAEFRKIKYEKKRIN